MILREYQSKLVDRAKKALSTNNNTLAVAATGAGKTIMLSALAGKIKGKTLILQHRDELTVQNMTKFNLINPSWKLTRYDSREKDLSGQAVFAMVPTLARHANGLPKFDHLIIDEAHHATAETYMRIIESVRHPDLVMSGWTATPARSDGFGLKRAGFDNCCDEVTIRKLVELGFLVPPKAFICQLDGVDLSDVGKTSNGEFDMVEVEEILDIEVHNQAVVEHWKEKAIGRKTIVFCSTVKHAENVSIEFNQQGVKSFIITGETPRKEREQILFGLEHGDIQVVCNVAVLTEGYDCPPVSCVVLLRPCSFKSTMLQMIGRGLRTVDASSHPDIVKTDCVILDFGSTLETHGDLYLKPMLDDRPKTCPQCGANVPPGTIECQLCGFSWLKEDGETRVKKEKDITDEFEMAEIDILNQSPFKWCDLFETGKAMVAKGFTAMTGVFSADGVQFIAVGRVDRGPLRIIQRGAKPQCLSMADDFLRQNEDGDAAKKTKRWLRDKASDKQRTMLQRYDYGPDYGFTKYSANCHLAFQWNKQKIERALGV